MKTVTLPPCWTINQIKSSLMPRGERIGDLIHNAHYCYRGIPFMLPMDTITKRGCWYLYLDYWQPFTGQWIRLGEVDTTKGIYSGTVVALDPVIDILIGQNKRLSWDNL